MARPSLKGRIGPSLQERVDRDSFFRLSADLPRLVEIDTGAIAPNPEQPRLRLDEAALDRLCLDRIARFKRPKAYLQLEALPKNHYGKVLKTELRALVKG